MTAYVFAFVRDGPVPVADRQDAEWVLYDLVLGWR